MGRGGRVGRGRGWLGRRGARVGAGQRVPGPGLPLAVLRPRPVQGGQVHVSPCLLLFLFTFFFFMKVHWGMFFF